jgi:hypothetical protein
MKTSIKTLLSLLLIAVIAAGCTGEPAQEEMDMDTLMTAAIGTMMVSLMETQTALAPIEPPAEAATITPLPSFTPYPTNTFAPANSQPLASPTFNFVFPTATFGLPLPAAGTPLPTGTQPTATTNVDALAVGCNNLAFVRDTNMPPGTVLQKGEEFTKVWKVQNTGSCEWPLRFRLVLLSGAGEKISSDFIGRIVAPWDWADVSISGTAPSQPGTYTSYWRMTDGGNMFGATLTLSFVVGD